MSALRLMLAVSAVALTIASHVARAQSPAGQIRPGLPSGIAPCESCHGMRGEGNAAMASPRIAGQSEEYLLRQLDRYALGTRPSPVMGPVAKSLDQNRRKAMAAYYASLKAPGPSSPTPEKAGSRANALATQGDKSAGVQACANCHGPQGVGEPPGYPALAGQQASYLLATLRAWHDGSRNTDPSGQMGIIARRLTDEDMAALADYYAGLVPPDAQMFRPSRPPTRVGKTAAPNAAAGQQGGPQAGSAGTEQGEPTTGGSQGPGGGGATRERMP